MHRRDAVYLDGRWARPHGTEMLDVVDPSTEEVIGTVPLGDAEDVERAVRAAVRAFPGWAGTARAERVALVRRIGDLIAEHVDELTEIVVADLGMPRALAREFQVCAPAATFALAADLAATSPDWSTVDGAASTTRIVRDPAGVVGVITPWNFPLQEIAAKLAPALAVGCTVVVKPSEVTPLAAFRLLDLVHEAGLPPGVVNLICGTGPVAGEALASHPAVDLVSFTGSTRAGRRVAELAAGTTKRVSLELGGKSPNVLLDDADLDRCVPAGVANAFLNSGQTCNALTRMLVPLHRLADVERIARAAADDLVVGDPRADGTALGPVVSDVQRDRVRGSIRAGVAEGATLLTGGVEPPAGLDRGYYVRPTLFSGVRPAATVATAEIFGPVLSIVPYEDEDEAVAIANKSEYGLAAGVWSAEPDRALRVARRLRVGQVHVNGGEFDLGAPFGGYKASGYGREGGRFGLEEFTEVKALLLADPEEAP